MSVTTRRQPALVLMSPVSRTVDVKFRVVDDNDHPTSTVSGIVLYLEAQSIDVKRPSLLSLINTIQFNPSRIPMQLESKSSNRVDDYDPVCVGNAIYYNTSTLPCLRMCVCKPNLYCFDDSNDECVGSILIAPSNVNNTARISGTLNRFHIEMLRLMQDARGRTITDGISLSMYGGYDDSTAYYTRYGLSRSCDERVAQVVCVNMNAYPKSPLIVIERLNVIGMYNDIASIIMKYLSVHETQQPVIRHKNQIKNCPSLIDVDMMKTVHTNMDLKYEDVLQCERVGQQETIFSCHTTTTNTVSYSFVLDIGKTDIRHIMLSVGGEYNNYRVYVQFVSTYNKHPAASRRFFKMSFFNTGTRQYRDINFYNIVTDNTVVSSTQYTSFYDSDDRFNAISPQLVDISNGVNRIRVVIQSQNDAPMLPRPVDVLIFGKLGLRIMDSDSSSGVLRHQIN
jgi:hypothetical protein